MNNLYSSERTQQATASGGSWNPQLMNYNTMNAYYIMYEITIIILGYVTAALVATQGT